MKSNCRTLPMRLPLWSAAILVTLLLNPLSAFSSDSPSHRLAGVVWISPTCGGPQREGDLCRSPLTGVEVRLSERGGRIAASATTDATGAFAMKAPAGRYRLHVVVGVKMTRCPDLDVTLPTVKSAPVELECDSGMR
jgi:hypothetical protein